MSDGALMVGYIGFKAKTNHDLLPIWQSMSSLSFGFPFTFSAGFSGRKNYLTLSIACWGRHSDCGRSQRRRYLRCGLYNPKFERDLILWRLLWIAVGISGGGHVCAEPATGYDRRHQRGREADLIAAWGSGPTALLFIYLNKGDGTFSAPTTTTITTDTNLWPVPMSVIAADYDGDGKADVIAPTSDEDFSVFATGMAMELLLRPKPLQEDL